MSGGSLVKEESIDSDFIRGYYIDKSLCDNIIESFEANNNLTTPGLSGGAIRENIKKSEDQLLKEYPHLYKRYMNKLQGVVSEYINEYEWCDMYNPFDVDDLTNIQKYVPNNGFFGWHTERAGNHPEIQNRHLVFMTYLNDVTDAGETEWLYQQIKIKPKKGLTVIWPADWTFTHRGVTSPTQTKYIVTGWLSYIDYDKLQMSFGKNQSDS